MLSTRLMIHVQSALLSVPRHGRRDAESGVYANPVPSCLVYGWTHV